MKAIYNNQLEAGPKGPAFACSKRIWRNRPWSKIAFFSLFAIVAHLYSPDQTGAEEKADSNAVLSAKDSAKAPHPREKSYIKRTWGVETLFVREASAGYMLEFRYKVLDAKKAAPLFVRATKPVLIDAETGAELIVPTPPTTGALRNSNTPIEGKTYWMFFANPGKLIKPGQRVSIKIGDFRVDDIVVEP